MLENNANDNNTILGISLLSNGNVLDLAILHGKCTCSSKANKHFIIYKVAKEILMYKISIHKSFGSPWPSKQ